MRALYGLLLLTLPLVSWADWQDIEAAGDYEGSWQIERLQPEHNRAYFDAYQSSQSMLLESLGWGWPVKKTSAERNLDTMKFHYQQHEDGAAYSYVLLSPEQGELLGALFVAPVQTRADLPDFEAGNYDAEVTFWLNEAGQNHAAAPALLEDVLQWLADDWQLQSVLFPVSVHNDFARSELAAQGVRMVHEDQNNDELLYQFRAR